MNTNDYIIRLERNEDYRAVENLVRESFWNVYRPGCSEHYVIHVLRDDPAFVKELDFVVFDKGIKKVCRYNQYFGIKRTQQRLNNLRTELHNPNRDPDKPMGGILWHTQGSGKTLTMVWLAKWILTHWAELNARVLIVTDRDELDEQIEKTFTGVDENIARTKSGKDLLNRLNVYDDSLICSLVHKFGRRGGEATENDYDKYIEELKASLPADFEAKGNLVVFVDECHRTQSGKLHTAMKTIMPNAVFIGFTGTPLLKKDKKISIEVFGTYIHAYIYNEGVADGVVLDLRYEYRDVPQDLSSQDRVDQWFDVKTRGLSSRAKAKLKEKWGTMQKVYSSRSRLEKVAWDSPDLMRLLVPTFTSTRGCRITACFRRFAASTALMMIVKTSAISWITSSCLDSSRLQ